MGMGAENQGLRLGEETRMGGVHHLRRNMTHAHVTSRGFARMALLSLGLLTLLLAACAPDGGSQVGLSGSQVFTWPYVSPWGDASQPNNPAYVIGGPGASGHVAVLDPAVVSYANDMSMVALMYAPLVTFDRQLHLVYDAATKIDVSSDATTYTIHLRENLKFSDGKPLQAADYAYSIDRALDPTLCSDTTGLDGKTYVPANSCPTQPNMAATYLGEIVGADARGNGAGGSDHSVIGQGDDSKHGVDVIDPYTLRIRLVHPAAYFLGALTYPTAYPVERSLVEKYPGGLWVDHLDEGGCSGPFMVKSYGGGKTLQLVKNPYWEQAWDKKLTLTEVDRPLFLSTEDEYVAYKSGLYDYTDIPGNKYFNAQTQDGFHEVPVLQTDYFGLNFKRAPFDNQNVRQAFALALNKQLLVDTVERGGALPTNHIVPRNMPGFNAALVGSDGTSSITGNADAAKSKLQAAIDQCNADAKANMNPYTGIVTWPAADDFCPYIVDGSKSKEIDFWYKGSNQTRQELTQGATATWQKVLGLNVQAKPGGSEYSHNVTTPGNPYQAWIIGWVADYPDPQDFLSLQFTTGATYNTSGMSDAGWDKLVAHADAEIDATQRMKDYNEAEQQAVNLVPWIPLLQPKSAWFSRPWVQGFDLNSQLLIIDTDWTKVYITSH